MHIALTARASSCRCRALLLSPSDRVAAQPSGDRATIEEITVIGRYPGPPLWKVTSGDRTLWIFGDLTPGAEGARLGPAQRRARARSRRRRHRRDAASARRRTTRSGCSALLRAARRLVAQPRRHDARRRRCRPSSTHATPRCAHATCPTTTRTMRTCGRRSPRYASMAPRSTTPASRRTPASARRSSARCAARDAEEATSSWRRKPEDRARRAREDHARGRAHVLRQHPDEHRDGSRRHEGARERVGDRRRRRACSASTIPTRKATASRCCSRPPGFDDLRDELYLEVARAKPSTRSRRTTRRSPCCRCASSSRPTACSRSSRRAATPSRAP